MVWLIGLRDPASSASYRRFHPAFPGGCVWARWAGCPRRLLTKKLTKSYTRSPVAYVCLFCLLIGLLDPTSFAI